MQIFAKAWGLYALILFLLFMALCLPGLLFVFAISDADKGLRRNIYFLHRVFSPVFLTLIGIRVKVSGASGIQPDERYVIVSNHRTTLDFIVNAVAFPRPYRYLAKHELVKVPVFGWVVRRMCLTVDRSSPGSRSASASDLKRALLQGWNIMIYPEGRRNTTSAPLTPFYDGAFRLSMETGKPLLAQTLPNVHRHNRGLAVYPGTVRVIWHPPYSPEQFADTNAFKEAVRADMLNALQN
jgi:1-acyl-sn-glycerol-3-phosphate acyltransferase